MTDPAERTRAEPAEPVESVDLGEIRGDFAESLKRGLGQHQAVPVRDAATVVLLRDGAAGLEVLVQRRVAKMAFAAGMTVFPGGAVEPADHLKVRWSAPPPDDLPAQLGAAEDLARAIVVAGARETFEEVGILLAGGADAPPLAETDRWRQRLEQGESTFADLLRAHGLTLGAEVLKPWSIWVTPVGEPRRYDTRFLLAGLPAGQAVRALASEAESAWWAGPAELLDRVTRGAVTMLPPTLQTLRDLTGYRSAADALAAARDRRVRRFRPEFAVDPDTGTLHGTLRIEQPAVPG